MTRALKSMTAFLAPAVVCAALVGSVAKAGTRDVHVTMTFIPTDTEEVLEKRGVIPAGGPPFEILPAIDTRPEPRSDVGENRERAVPVRIWTSSNVSQWVTKTLTDTFRDWGTVSTSGSQLVLQPEVVKLFVVEEHTYQAEAVMKFTLSQRAGPEIWSGVVGGAASRFGRSLKEENYKEVISDAVFACYSKLWTDEGFRNAWSGKGGARGGDSAVKQPPSQVLDPEAVLKKLLELKEAGFEEETLLSWIRKIGLTRALTADDMLEWKNAGVPQSVIRAAME